MSGGMGVNRRNRHSPDPEKERRRRLLLQAAGLLVLALITGFLVFKALTVT